MKYITIATAVLMSMATAWSASKYQAAAVENGGTIVGMVKKSGDIPEDPVLKVSKDDHHCGKTMKAEKFVINDQGGIKWSVVSLADIKKGKAWPKDGKYVTDNINCRFIPHVLVAPQGGTIVSKNSDPVAHNAHFYLVMGEKRKTLANLMIPNPGQEVPSDKVLRRPGVIDLKCDLHDWMQGWVISSEHPYAVVTDDAGSFKMEDVPPGTYTIKVWHEALGEKEQKVKVESGKEAKVDFSY